MYLLIIQIHISRINLQMRNGWLKRITVFFTLTFYYILSNGFPKCWHSLTLLNSIWECLLSSSEHCEENTDNTVYHSTLWFPPTCQVKMVSCQLNFINCPMNFLSDHRKPSILLVSWLYTSLDQRVFIILFKIQKERYKFSNCNPF